MDLSPASFHPYIKEGAQLTFSSKIPVLLSFGIISNLSSATVDSIQFKVDRNFVI